MATRKPAAKRARKPASKPAETAVPAKAPRKRTRKPAKVDADSTVAAQASTSPRPASTSPRPPSASQRERRFNSLIQAACLKAGTAAAVNTITGKVPLLGRLAPLVLGSVGESSAQAKVQQQLVRDVIETYDLELSDAEERGVILLATAVSIGAQQISKETVEQLIEQMSGRFYRPVISRMLPLASVATEAAAAVASTYTVGKRAQALCKLPGTGARDLSDLLRGLSGIDQSKLFSWTVDAFSLALQPFRGALMAMIPGMGKWPER